MYLSTKIGCSWATVFISLIYSSISASSYAIAIPCPPKTYDGLTKTGYPNLFATCFASSTVNIVLPFGLNIPQLFNASSNSFLSSALSISTSAVPSILTPISDNAFVNFIAV